MFNGISTCELIHVLLIHQYLYFFKMDFYKEEDLITLYLIRHFFWKHYNMYFELMLKSIFHLIICNYVDINKIVVLYKVNFFCM